MRLTVPPKPFIRPNDTLLSPKEALATTDAMLKVIKDCYDWGWPSPESHLASTEDPDENEQDYIKRMSRLEAWPRKKAESDAQWIRCALITARALSYLQQCSFEGQALHGKSSDYHFNFNPKSHGLRSWKRSPEMPKPSETNVGAWCSENALGFVKMNILLVITLDNLLPAPKDQELIHYIREKTKQAVE
ncbi:hypothetical protein K458DRAFT_439060 [Lentithecium fluviatile CBS 122367]|uniref:Uncharacterized protein n=1 Tax=Lentithecium fluviatile CBS 122367 TaxID=1168545 RepID=A0A6G1JH84_9PLEO|nr:hypothetical protein K458DRAFT_439060 [Lentithecium fluviatile CBS 122367]